MSSPCLPRLKMCTAAMPASTATSGAGTTGATLRKISTTASEPRPTATVSRWAWPRLVIRCHSWSKKFPRVFADAQQLGYLANDDGQR